MYGTWGDDTKTRLSSRTNVRDLFVLFTKPTTDPSSGFALVRDDSVKHTDRYHLPGSSFHNNLCNCI